MRDKALAVLVCRTYARAQTAIPKVLIKGKPAVMSGGHRMTWSS